MVTSSKQFISRAILRALRRNERNLGKTLDSICIHSTSTTCAAKMNRRRYWLMNVFFISGSLMPLWNAGAQSWANSSPAFVRYARQLRTAALFKFAPKDTFLSGKPGLLDSASPSWTSASLLDRLATLHGALGQYHWKLNIVTTTFWIGERASANNPTPNNRSSWDGNWSANYGGYDDPSPNARHNFVPIHFVPQQNPFYVALPYNDIEGAHTKPEAKQVIPWFGATFVRDGQTVLKGRWLSVRHNNKVCYAQWEDCGPFRTADWRYVFGDERPKPNLNQGAGLDVSPAVRDYLGINAKDFCDWKFADFREVPPGPWATYGDNNPFVHLQRQATDQLAKRTALNSETPR
jgi:hypothetical protein